MNESETPGRRISLFLGAVLVGFIVAHVVADRIYNQTLQMVQTNKHLDDLIAQETKAMEKAAVNTTPIVVGGSKTDAYTLFKINPKNYPNVWWYSSDPSRVGIDEKGAITPVWNGKAYICMQPFLTQTAPRTCWRVAIEKPGGGKQS